ncbi:fumarylacetoacetate hydrolase family protein [bacterium]|nr:fumarylacetoacetate hydrolase family protein [bacterium]
MKIICVGRNYSEHISELKNEVPTDPVLFMKPDSALMRSSDKFYIPEWTKDVHYEVELVVRIDRLGKNIEERFAHKYYSQISLGIDFTARDLQTELKSKGLPWEKAKAFDRSAVVGPWRDKEDYDLQNLNFSLLRNGDKVQEGNSSQMLNGIDALISYISQFFTLKIGDLIFTGTPKGVGRVEANDQLEGYLEDRKMFSVGVR